MRPPRPARRHFKVRLNPDLVASMLNLPDSAAVVRFEETADPPAVWVHIEHPEAAPVSPDDHTPCGRVTGEAGPFVGDPVTWSAVLPDREPVVHRASEDPEGHPLLTRLVCCGRRLGEYPPGDTVVGSGQQVTCCG